MSSPEKNIKEPLNVSIGKTRCSAFVLRQRYHWDRPAAENGFPSHSLIEPDSLLRHSATHHRDRIERSCRYSTAENSDVLVSACSGVTIGDLRCPRRSYSL